ncbi:hypothetical protein [Bradyrhizobium septentrionale]|uniref:Uncharacterized protein n=1 Tax=Bradyrhizobium septentrionale TaxID=1404411 RepID=A0ABZ2NRC1_9BRAD
MEANRRNAKHSTGPKTDQGKARSSGNALRHGLSRPGPHDNAGGTALTQALLDRLAQEALSIEPAEVVQAKLELARIRAVRRDLLAAFLKAPDAKLRKRLRGLERYERAAFARQRRVMRARSR